MKREEQIHAIMEKYYFSEPLAPEIQEKLYLYRKEALKSVMKKLGIASLFTSVVIAFFMWAKKIGISITVAKSAVIVTAASVAAAGAISVGGYVSVKKILKNEKKPAPIEKKIEKQKEVKQVVNEKGNESEAKKRINPAVKKYRAYIVPFVSTSDDKAVGNITRAFNRHLRKMKGRKISRIAAAPEKGYKYSMKITGKVLKLGKTYRLSAKIINLKNKKIIAAFSTVGNNKKELSGAAKKLADKIAKKL